MPVRTPSPLSHRWSEVDTIRKTRFFHAINTRGSKTLKEIAKRRMFLNGQKDIDYVNVPFLTMKLTDVLENIDLDEKSKYQIIICERVLWANTVWTTRCEVSNQIDRWFLKSTGPPLPITGAGGLSHTIRRHSMAPIWPHRRFEVPLVPWERCTTDPVKAVSEANPIWCLMPWRV